jgi:hypothetical protein
MAKKRVNADQPLAFACDKCDRAFTTNTALGVHKRFTHNIPGKHIMVALEAQAKNETHTRTSSTSAAPQRGSDDKLQCPLCRRTFMYEKPMMKHLERVHGIPESSSTSIALPNQSFAPNGKAPDASSSSPTAIDTPNSQTPGRDPIPYFLAIGRVTELCRYIAEEHDIPSNVFTREFAVLLYNQTRR